MIPLIKKIDKDVIPAAGQKNNIGRSMLDVGCSTFNLFAVPAGRSILRALPLA